MNKIVAFIDILGFTVKVTSSSHEDAVKLIKSFNSEIYRLWEEKYQGDNSIFGLTFSDSLIVYANNHTDESLHKLLSFLKEMYQLAVVTCNILLRGGISIGEFDNIQVSGFSNLEKCLVIGKAYIEAYKLESETVKGSKLVFYRDVYEIIENLSGFNSKKCMKMNDGQQLYELIWADMNFLNENIKTFVHLANQSKWLDHYYFTLETFLAGETRESEHNVFSNILQQLESNEIDTFIENFMRIDGAEQLKQSFLAFLRNELTNLNNNKMK